LIARGRASQPAPRRFAPPWTLDEANNACFIVRDATGQALDYFYFENEPSRRSAARLLTRDEAKRRGSSAGAIGALHNLRHHIRR
jgi:hypothetical protein